MDPNFTLALIIIYSIAAMLLGTIVLALVLGKSDETKRLITALRDLFKKLK